MLAAVRLARCGPTCAATATVKGGMNGVVETIGAPRGPAVVATIVDAHTQGRDMTTAQATVDDSGAM